MVSSMTSTGGPPSVAILVMAMLAWSATGVAGGALVGSGGALAGSLTPDEAAPGIVTAAIVD